MNSPDYDQRAAEALGAARFRIDKLAEAARPGENEAVAIRANTPDRWDEARFDRMIEVCGAAHMATENAIKAFTAGVTRQMPKHEHRIEVLLDALPVPARQEFEKLSFPLKPEDLNPWRTAATYVYEEESLSILAQITPNFAADIYSAALASCEHAASEVLTLRSSDPKSVRAAKRLQESVRQAHDARYVHMMRGEPSFAKSTYTARGMQAHPEALQQPLMPSRGTRLQTAWDALSRFWGILTPKRRPLARVATPPQTEPNASIPQKHVSNKRPSRKQVSGRKPAATSNAAAVPASEAEHATSKAPEAIRTGPASQLRQRIVQSLKARPEASYAQIAQSLHASPGYVAQIARQEGLTRSPKRRAKPGRRRAKPKK